MKAEFSISGHRIANNGRCFVIAEAGVNHNGEAELAHRLVDAVADSGAQAIKFQTFNADALVTASARKARYQVENTGTDDSQFGMLKALELPVKVFEKLREHALQRGLVFISTPFDEASADMLEKIGVPAFKVSSGDLNNHLLLEHIAAKGKPMIISTGMATLGEIEDALNCLTKAGAAEVCALQCTSSYPAPSDQINLRVMETLKSAFAIPIGYSDHTMGLPVSIAAATLGAAVIEKHVTLDRNLPGPDHRASLEPSELTRMMSDIREVEAALGSPVKAPVAAEVDTRDVARRSLFARHDITPGHVIAKTDLMALRPGSGISPDQRGIILGHKARHAIAAGHMLTIGDLE